MYAFDVAPNLQYLKDKFPFKSSIIVIYSLRFTPANHLKNAGNGCFGRSRFQNFPGEHARAPLGALACRCLAPSLPMHQVWSHSWKVVCTFLSCKNLTCFHSPCFTRPWDMIGVRSEWVVSSPLHDAFHQPKCSNQPMAWWLLFQWCNVYSSRNCPLRWPKSVTAKAKASRQNKESHGKIKNLTAK